MLHLHRTKTVRVNWKFFLLPLVSFFSIAAQAQKEIYREEQQYKPYYFGITLSAVSSRFHTELHESFLQQDSILVAEPLNSAGISIRLLAALRLTQRFELRFTPGLIFGDRTIAYQLRYKDRDLGFNVNKNVESVLVTFPFNIKFQSDRIGNFRVYMMGGGKFDYDLASNANARRAEDMIKIGKTDYGIEGGIGFNFYRKIVTISPELKISNGMKNLHSRDEKLKYSSVLDRINSRMIIFSLFLEG